ncbi:MAG: hypothetical protein WCJ30_20690, partial [Deltaproteobacteria bacterium]
TLLASPTAREEGNRPRSWLVRALPVVLDALGRASEVDAPRDTLAALALLPDVGGALHAAADRVIARASQALRDVYRAERPLLDATIDLAPTPGQATLLARLGVPVLGLDDLCADLADPARRATLAAPERSPVLLAYLATQPAADLAASGLAALPLCPDDLGELRALRADPERDAAWLTLGDPPGRFVRAMLGARPPLVERSLNTRFAGLFTTLGARTLDWSALCEMLARGDLAPTTPDLGALHAAIRGDLGELSPRLRASLARAPVWPDRRGTQRPLEGPGRALWPADESLSALWPDAPWLVADLASTGALPSSLGARPVGTAAVARAMLCAADEGEPTLDARDAAALSRAYACLCSVARGSPVPATLLERLAAAPLWRDTQGVPRALAALQRPAVDPALAALYAAWDSFAVIETVPQAHGAGSGATASACDAAAAIGLGERVRPPTFDSMIDDLLGADGSPPDSGSVALRQVLSRASLELAPTRLSRLSHARIFRAGPLAAAHTLARWSDPTGVEGMCCRGGLDVALRAAIACSDRPLMVEEDERALAPLLDALGVRAPGPWDLVHAIEHAVDARAHAVTARRALVASRSAFEHTAEATARLSALAVWPTRDGALRASRDVVRATSLARDLGDDWDARSATVPTSDAVVLDASAEHDAAALGDLCVFRSPAAFVVARV